MVARKPPRVLMLIPCRYRNMQRKAAALLSSDRAAKALLASSGRPGQQPMAPPRHCPAAESPASSATEAMQQGGMPVTVREIRRSGGGGPGDLDVIFFMQEVGERLVPAGQIPQELLPALEAYDQQLRENLALSEAALTIMRQSPKTTLLESLPADTTNLCGAKPSPRGGPPSSSIGSASRPADGGHEHSQAPPGGASGSPANGGLVEFETQPGLVGNQHDRHPSPLRQPPPSPATSQRDRIVSKIKRARINTAPSDLEGGGARRGDEKSCCIM